MERGTMMKRLLDDDDDDDDFDDDEERLGRWLALLVSAPVVARERASRDGRVRVDVEAERELLRERRPRRRWRHPRDRFDLLLYVDAEDTAESRICCFA